MNEKTTSSIISEAIARQLSFPRRTTDAFIKAFTETIVEGLQTDGMVKVRGLGTFKLVDVEERESVSVTTGERITIPSFKKLSFIPEESVGVRLAERLGITPSVDTPDTMPEDEDATLEDETEENAGSTETLDEEEPEEEAVAKEAAEEAEPVAVEAPADKFSGIDVLISTPESLDDLHQQLSEAQEHVEQKQSLVSAAEAHVAAAREMVLQIQQQLLLAEADVATAETHVATAQNAMQKARDEVSNLEQLIDNVESNRKTVLAVSELAVEEEAATPMPSVEEKNATPEEPEVTDTSKTADEEPSRSPWSIIVIILLTLAILGTALYFALRKPTAPADEIQPKQEQTATPPAKVKPQKKKQEAIPTVQEKDSIKTKKAQEPAVIPPPSKPEQTKQAKEQPKQPKQTAKPQRPATYVIQQGESLTRIAQRFYGSKDSVRAIIRANKIKNPDNVSAGATIKLP